MASEPNATETLTHSEICTPHPAGGYVCNPASAVAIHGAAVLFFGPSGSGKSATCLQLMGLGADLIADDMVILQQAGADILLSAPENAPNLIEARGLGLLNAPLRQGPCPLRLVVSLAEPEPERLPPPRKFTLDATAVPLILGADRPNLAFMILQYMKHGLTK